MTKAEVIRNEIIDAAKTISEAALSKLDYLYLGEAVITLVDDFSSTYEFLYQGETYTGVSLTGEKYSVDDIVYVLFSNANDIKKMIVSKKQRYSSMEMGEAVLSYNNLTDLPDIKLVATTGDYNDLINKPALKTVATTGAHSDLTGIPVQATRWPTWTEVSSKPATFEPAAHNQAWSTITGPPAQATRWPAWSEVTSRPSDSQFPDTAVSIGGSQNLNNYTTPGFYYQSANASAASGSNYPVDQAGTLVVTKDAGTTQMYYHYNGSGVYYRTLYGSTWTAWTNLLTPSWANVSGKPTTFAPSTHNHTWSQLSSGSTAAIPTSGSSGTWTSVNMSGSKGGYAGIYFTDYSRFFMVNASIQGFHTGSAWQWYFSNGALAVGTVPWSLVSGKPTVPAVPADYVVERGSNYNKWNSGMLEMWGTTSLLAANTDYVQALPVKCLSDATTSITMTANRGGGYNNLNAQAKRMAGSLQAFNYNIYSGATGITVSADYYIRGRWK